jgi:peroxiredoxin Q/BCP
MDFTILKDKFEKIGYQIIWVSKDSISSHQRFIEKKQLNIPLISDEELYLHKKYWVWWEKKNYGKVYMWTIRSTFVLNENCEIIKEYRNVKASSHAQRVLDDLKN